MTTYFRGGKNQLSTKPFNLSLCKAEWKKHHSHLLHISTSMVWNFDLVTPWRLFSWDTLSLLFMCEKENEEQLAHAMSSYLFCLQKKNKKHQNICVILDLTLIFWLLLPLLFSQCCLSVRQDPSLPTLKSQTRTILNKYPVQISLNIPRQNTTQICLNKQTKRRGSSQYSVHRCLFSHHTSL